MSAEFQKKCFTITWRIENYDLLFEFVKWLSYSPWFTVDIFEKSKFRLFVAPISLLGEDFMRLLIEKDSSGPSTKMVLNYHFCVFSDQCSSSRFEKTFRDFSDSYLIIDVPKSEVYKREGEKLLPPDFLTVQCKIWKKQGFLSEYGECILITKPQIKRISFVGEVENFSDLKCGKNKAIRIRSASAEGYLLSINIGLTNEREIFIEISRLSYEKICPCQCVLYLLDSTGNEVKCGEGENGSWFRGTWIIPLQFSKRNPMDLDKKYLPKDCLSLQFEITFYAGEMEIKFVKTKYAANLSNNIEQPTSGRQNKIEVIQEENRFMSTVQDDLISLLSSGTLSDTKLRTATEIFPSHKNILSARSPVFKAMFTSNMKEKINDYVEIEDLDPETMRRLLLFLYSDTLQDLDFESAKKLYFAGDKYEVLILKSKCSRFLLDNLNPSNCCDVLMLADRHSDLDLKKATQEYISRHDEEVLQADQWKHLEETNPVLSLETFRIMYQRNRKNSASKDPPF